MLENRARPFCHNSRPSDTPKLTFTAEIPKVIRTTFQDAKKCVLFSQRFFPFLLRREAIKRSTIYQIAKDSIECWITAGSQRLHSLVI